MTEAEKTQCSSLAKASTPPVVGSTFLPKRELSYRWIIHDAKIFLDQCQEMRSPTFSVSLPLKSQLKSSKCHEHDSLWYLSVKKQLSQCWSNPPVNNVYLSLWHDTKEGTSTQASKQPGHKSEVWLSDIAFSFIDLKTNKVLHTVIGCCNGTKCAINVSCSLNKSKMIENDNIDRYLCDGKLTIQVSATLHCITAPTETISLNEECELPQDNVSTAMRSMLADRILTDVIIKCGNEEFKAHKAVLASQSPVFRRMFETNMKEKKASEIEIPDFDARVIQEVLTYLYTGSVSNMDDHVRDLFEIADKYELSRLLVMCEKQLRSDVNTSNVIELLILADLHKSSYLKKACLNFIHYNSATVYASSQWKQLKENRDSYVSLIMEVLEYTP